MSTSNKRRDSIADSHEGSTRFEPSTDSESIDDSKIEDIGDAKEIGRLARGELSVVSFYVGLWWPLGLPPVARYTLFRDEEIPWDRQVAWPEWFGLGNANLKKNFVLASFHRHEHVQEFDPRIGLYAMDLAENSLTEYSSGNQAIEDSRRIQGEITEDRIYNYGNELLPASNTPATIVELMTPLFEDPSGKLDPVTFAFNRCLEELNLVETAYLLTTRDIRVRNTTRATCFPSVPFLILHTETGMLQFRSHLMVNYGLGVLPYDVEDLEKDGINTLGTFILHLKREDALSRYSERTTIARRAREIDGDLASAMLHLYTAGEMLLDTVLLQLAWEEATFIAPGSLSESEVANWFSGNSSLRSRNATRYNTRLRGGWELTEPTRPLYDWFGFVSDLRNRTVHSGYVPKEWEVVATNDILTNLEHFIKDLLCDDRNRLRYPRTALMIVAIPGFERRGLLTRRVLDLLQNETVDWGLSFRDWRRRVEAKISR